MDKRPNSEPEVSVPIGRVFILIIKDVGYIEVFFLGGG